MDPLDPLDAAMMTAELLSHPLHVAAVLILSPPDDAGPGYVDELHRQALAATDPVDPRLRRYPHRGLDTGGIWVWRDADTLDISHHAGASHCRLVLVEMSCGGWSVSCMPSDSTRLARCGCRI